MTDPDWTFADASVYFGNALTVLETLPSESVHCIVTSPPYWGLRDYGTGKWVGGDSDCDHLGPPMQIRANINRNCGTGVDRKNAECREFFREVCGKCGARRVDKQLGLEPTPEEYVDNLVRVFRAARRVLRNDGTLWLNLGDTYSNGCSGYKPKDLVGVPWMTAFALRADGWYLRQGIVWNKPSTMPESITDRCTKSHEFIFLLSKSEKYHFDHIAIREPAVYPAGTRAAKGSAKRYAEGGVNARPPEYKVYDGMRNKRDVWTVSPARFAGSHYATFPPDLIEPCILAGCPESGTVLDPFVGTGTTLFVALRNGRRGIGIDLDRRNLEHIKARMNATDPDMFEDAEPDLFEEVE